jgi:uncharacterized protein YbaP (TraB family)
MKNLAFIIALIISSSFSAQSLEKSLLWKIYGNGAKDTSYLYGTIHMIEKKDFVVSKTLKNRFKKTESLVMEIQLDMDPAAKAFIKDNALYPNGKSIKDYLNETDYNYFQTYLKDSMKMGVIKVKICEMMRPFYAQSLIMADQMKNSESYEKSFHKMAKKKEKLGLETIQEQMSILASGELDVQVKDFIRDIKDGKLNASSEMAKLVSFYKNQDIQGLYNEMIVSMEKDGGKIGGVTKEDFLDNRNKRWIPKLADFMKNKTLFIAVGAGHLAGEFGVIQLLRNQGYTVMPIKQ